MQEVLRRAILPHPVCTQGVESGRGDDVWYDEDGACAHSKHYLRGGGHFVCFGYYL
jgi:hypothetical protein